MGDIGFLPLMIGMTVVAVTSLGQTTVQPQAAIPLLDDTGMATFTAIGRGATPPCMAQSAFLLKIGMGSKSRQLFTL